MTKFTPGPWRLSAVKDGWPAIGDQYGSIICEMKLNNPANDLLIAAAPELYESLKTALDILKAAGVQEVALQGIRAVLSKVEGD